MEVVWMHIFNKPKGSDINKQEEGLDIGEPKLFFEGNHTNQMPRPFTPHTQFP